MADPEWITEDVPPSYVSAESITIASKIPSDAGPFIGPPACFLTSVQGKFMGTGEEVWVQKRQFSGGGGSAPYWSYVLDITKNQPGVGAGATCVF
jgi:hypothetical protein